MNLNRTTFFTPSDKFHRILLHILEPLNCIDGIKLQNAKINTHFSHTETRLVHFHGNKKKSEVSVELYLRFHLKYSFKLTFVQITNNWLLRDQQLYNTI